MRFLRCSHRRERVPVCRPVDGEPYWRNGMSVDFANLLNGWLPGLYRDKDGSGELARFLQIAAGPLAEISASVEQLRQDFYINDCRDAFIPLIGRLIGVELDPT